jgi:hypothetical protein
MGGEYLDWLEHLLQGGGNRADLSAHFFRRTRSLLGAHGTVGLISTNTISQGDTRVVGLAAMLADGFVIYSAIRSMTWPGEAAVSVSVVHLAKGVATNGISQYSLDDLSVPMINSRLQAAPERDAPKVLGANTDLSFIGAKIYGQGFIVLPEERARLVGLDYRHEALIQPYLGGEEVNTSPTQSFDRYVIDFGQRSLAESEEWPVLLSIVREKVKPERDRVTRSAYRERWWQFGEPQWRMRAAVAALRRCIVSSQVTKHLCFSFQPTTRLFSQKLNVFPLDDVGALAILQSRIHETWAWLLSSTLEDRLNYSASDCFETFPFPQPDPRTVIPTLEDVGQRLYDTRAAYMIETQQGLTQTYNKLKDPACHDAPIVELRRLHEEMDRAVLDAYGWTDIVVPPFCPSTPAEQKALETFQDQVIDRLFVLNAERAEEERRAGLGKATKEKAAKEKPKGAKKPGKKSEGGGPQGELF